MTTETLAEAPLYTILTTGPYAVPHAYSRSADLLVYTQADDALPQLLDPADWSVSPATSEDGGDITLSADALADHEGEILIITRETLTEQGWVGQAAREKGLERQLDLQARSQQDLWALTDRMPRLRRGTEVHRPVLPDPVAGRALIGRSDGRGWRTGPSADQIENAQAYAERAEDARDETEAMLDIATGRLFFIEQDDESATFWTASDTVISDPGPGPFPSVTIEVLE